MIAGRDGDPLVRECAFTALVLIRAKGAPDGLSTLDGMKPREPLVLWARALDGGGATRAEYLRSIEMMLSGEVVESIPGVALPTLSVTSGAHHLDLEAKVTPETENLPLDLWRLGFIKDKRAIGVLIKALAYHRSTVQHMALDVLSNLVENPPASTRDTKEYDLHTLETHARWVAWWKGKEARLYWNPRTASFGLQ
jgi:hypothetical protein